jgi:hypothetical protein
MFIRFANSTNVADPALGNTISSDGIAMIAIEFVFAGVSFQRVWRWKAYVEILRPNCGLSDNCQLLVAVAVMQGLLTVVI